MSAEAPFLQTAGELTAWRDTYRTVALTNGCFDVLHRGHVEYLMAAAKKSHEMGLPLLVAINSDESIRRIKGAGRPINTLANRAKVLCALRCVDAVTSFDADTPRELVESMKPHLLIKAEDYKHKPIVGSDFVRANGGEVWLAPFYPGLSTTGLIQKGGASGDGA